MTDIYPAAPLYDTADHATKDFVNRLIGDALFAENSDLAAFNTTKLIPASLSSTLGSTDPQALAIAQIKEIEEGKDRKSTHYQKPLHISIPFTPETLVSGLCGEFTKLHELAPIIDRAIPGSAKTKP